MSNPPLHPRSIYMDQRIDAPQPTLFQTFFKPAAQFLAHINQRFDAITTESGRLWVSAFNMDTDCFDVIKKGIKRAGSAPLVIKYDDKVSPQRFNGMVWQHIIRNIGTWGYLSVQTSVYSDKRKLEAALARPAPLLEALKLHNLYFEAPVRMDNPHEVFVLPENLFAGCAYSLQHVSILNVYIPQHFNFEVWKQLTTFCVYHKVEQNQDVVLYSVKWLEILSSMPQLEQLSMGWQINCAETVPLFGSKSNYHSMPVICLGRLRQLEFETCHGYSQIAFGILEKLFVPGDCQIQLSLGHDVPFCLLEGAVKRLIKQWHSVHESIAPRWFNNNTKQAWELVFGFNLQVHSVDNAVLHVEFLEQQINGTNLWASARKLFNTIQTLVN